MILIKDSHGSGSAWVHSVCLIGLMAVITGMSVRFARPYKDEQLYKMAAQDQEVERDSRLKSRNKKFYYGRVAAMVAARALALTQQLLFGTHVKQLAPWLFYAEVIAFAAFGVAWFVKGRVIMQVANTRVGRRLRRTMQRLRGKLPVDA